MSMWVALLIVLGIFAFGDFLGVITKAQLSSVFVILSVFLVLFLTDAIPADIIDIAQLTGVSKMAAGFVIFNMGTTINVTQMIKEWRVVVMSMIAMGVAVAAILAVSPLIGFEAAIVSIPIVNGGIVAAQIMTTGAADAGLPLVASLGLFIYAVQKFFGTIPASRCGLAEAKVLATQYRESLANGIDLLAEDDDKSKGESEKKVRFSDKYAKYYTVYISLGLAVISVYIATLISSVTGVSYSVWTLLVGMVVSQLGLVPQGILDKGKSSGLFLVATFTGMIPSLAAIEISDLGGLAFQTIVIFVAVMVGCFGALYFLPLWKFIGSRNLAIGIAMSQLLGFPATLLIVNEVATAVATNEKEKEYIVKKLTPAFVVSGFVSVTTVSILIAGVLVNYL